MHFHLPLDSSTSVPCLLAVNVCRPHRNNEGFLNQLNLKRFELYANYDFVKKVLREIKLKVEDIKNNYFSQRFKEVKQW